MILRLLLLDRDRQSHGRSNVAIVAAAQHSSTPPPTYRSNGGTQSRYNIPRLPLKNKYFMTLKIRKSMFKSLDSILKQQQGVTRAKAFIVCKGNSITFFTIWTFYGLSFDIC